MSEIVARISNNVIKAEIVQNIIDVRIEGAVVSSGTASILTKTAGETLSGHRVVCVKSDGKVYYADANDIATRGIIGITNHAANEGEDITVQVSGQMHNTGGWAFTVGNYVFVGANGALSQTVNGTAYISVLGLATASDTILIEVQQIILL